MTEEEWRAVYDWFVIGVGISVGIGVGGALFMWVFL